LSTHEKIKDWERNEGAKIFAALNLPGNAVVLDYGSGFGHYTFAVARALDGQGQVYAVDINPTCNQYVRETAEHGDLPNITVQEGNKDYNLNFGKDAFDLVLYYDIFHGNGNHRYTLLQEAQRVLKPGGILSVLPFHLSNFRDAKGEKRKYTYAMIIQEVSEYGFEKIDDDEHLGLHFEKYHSPYYQSKGGIEFIQLEKAVILNFRKR
jgi:ubiquinone/menaquinone biosynthesis C-methylase UbiE